MARDRPSPYGNRPVGAVSNRAYGEPRSVGQDHQILPVRDQAIPNYGLLQAGGLSYWGWAR